MSNYPPPAPPTTPVSLRLPLTKPRATYIFLAIIVVVFIIEELSGGSQTSRVLIGMGANYGPLVTAGDYWRLFTANFLHIGFLHIAFNGYALYILGQETEALFGTARFVVIFLLSALAGAIASYAFTYGLSAGASTGIFGLIGTLIAFFVRNRQLFGVLGSSRLTNLIVVAAFNIFYGLTTPFIDNWGHVGGFIAGLTLGWLLCPFYQIVVTQDGTRRVIDRTSLRSESIGVGLFGVLLIVAFVAALSMHTR